MLCCCGVVDVGAVIMLFDHGLCRCGDAEFDATNGVNEVVVDVVVLNIHKGGEYGVLRWELHLVSLPRFSVELFFGY